MKNIIFPFLFLGVSGNVLAADDWVSIQNQILTQGKTEYSAASYCGGDSQCQSKVSDPSEKNYYTDSTSSDSQASHDTQLTNAGNTAFSQSGMGGEISERQANKQTVDLTDPAYGVYNNYVTDAVSNQYANCKAGTIGGSMSDSEATCYEPTNNQISCTLQYVQDGNSTIQTQKTQRITATFSQTSGTRTDIWRDRKSEYFNFTLYFPVSNFELVSIAYHGCGGEYAQYKWCGSGSKHDGQCHYSKSSEKVNDQIWFGGYQPYRLPHYANDVSLVNRVNVYNGQLSGKVHLMNSSCRPSFDATWIERKPVMHWVNSCSESYLRQNSCTVSNETCTVGAGTRNISGMSTYSSCWTKAQSWSCAAEDTCKALPHSEKSPDEMLPGDTNCVAVNKKCSLSVGGVCIQTFNTEKCSTKLPDDLDLTCDTSLECTGTPEENANNPKCKVDDYYSGTSMATAITKLSILKEIGGHFDPNSLRFFTGEPMACSKGALGTFNCCSDSGWANDVGAHSCSTEEKDLAVAKQKNMAIEVGTYCAEKTAFGICIRHKTSYCVYDSEISKITMSAAKSQLGKSFGESKNPDCTGLTQDELVNLNWDEVDWSPVIGDIQVTIPSVEELKSKVNTTVNSNEFSNGGAD